MRHILLLLVAACSLAQAPTGPCTLQAQELNELKVQVAQAEKDIIALRLELAETRGGRGSRIQTLERLIMIATLCISAYAVTRVTRKD